jgi:hypothetical protein
MCVTSLTHDFDNGGQLEINNIEYGGDRIAQLNKVAVETMYQIYLNDQKKAQKA